MGFDIRVGRKVIILKFENIINLYSFFLIMFRVVVKIIFGLVLFVWFLWIVGLVYSYEINIDDFGMVWMVYVCGCGNFLY